MDLQDLDNMDENVKIAIEGETFEIYSVRQDGKIYFWNVEDTGDQYTSTMEELHERLGCGAWALA